ncbi:MAG: hypothetical protein M3445_07410 [Actinomycetota bacterium]|nr:hypothetical protein [Actinomycetota bacterium]
MQSFGTHPGRRTHPDIAPEDVPNGTKLLDVEAEAGSNFLSPAIFEVAKDRVATNQDHETLDEVRLYRDPLSSMPMAFNLFGEASLPENEVSRERLAALFGVAAKPPSVSRKGHPTSSVGGPGNDRLHAIRRTRLGQAR